MSEFLKIKSISQLHQMIGYENPKHALITIIDYSQITGNPDHYDVKIVTDFYIISLKSPSPKSLKYGRQYYDFEEGTMMFIAPDQVFSVSEFNDQIKYKGWGIYIHPDLFLNSLLGKKIKNFSFFLMLLAKLYIFPKMKEIHLPLLPKVLLKNTAETLTNLVRMF